MPRLCFAFGKARRISSCTASVVGAPPKPTFSTLLRSYFSRFGWVATRGPMLPSAAHAVTRSFSISWSTASGSKRPGG
jgi:hypothetical protein